VHTKVDEDDRYKRLERVSGGEEQKVESSRLKSRYLWLYYLGQEVSLSRTSRYLCHGTAWSDGGHAIFGSN